MPFLSVLPVGPSDNWPLFSRIQVLISTSASGSPELASSTNPSIFSVPCLSPHHDRQLADPEGIEAKRVVLIGKFRIGAGDDEVVARLQILRAGEVLDSRC